MESKKEIFNSLKILAIAKGYEITAERLQIYCEYLSRYDLKKVLATIKKVFERVPKFPDISDLINDLDPEPNKTDEAVRMAGEIVRIMISAPTSSAAQKELGPEAWLVVEKFGGWITLRSIKNSELPQCRAQLRELSRSVLALRKTVLNRCETGYRISERERLDELFRLDVKVKQIEDKPLIKRLNESKQKKERK